MLNFILEETKGLFEEFDEFKEISYISSFLVYNEADAKKAVKYAIRRGYIPEGTTLEMLENLSEDAPIMQAYEDGIDKEHQVITWMNRINDLVKKVNSAMSFRRDTEDLVLANYILNLLLIISNDVIANFEKED